MIPWIFESMSAVRLNLHRDFYCWLHRSTLTKLVEISLWRLLLFSLLLSGIVLRCRTFPTTAFVICALILLLPVTGWETACLLAASIVVYSGIAWELIASRSFCRASWETFMTGLRPGWLPYIETFLEIRSPKRPPRGIYWALCLDILFRSISWSFPPAVAELVLKWLARSLCGYS